MSYSVDLEDDYLLCKSREAAHLAAERITAHCFMKYHLKVEALHRVLPQEGPQWYLGIVEFDGCGWNDEASRELWLELAPHLADGSLLEFRGESAERWRIRWEGGRVYEEFVQEVVWKVAQEILPPVKGVSP